jgi:hypothetical protein
MNRSSEAARELEAYYRTAFAEKKQMSSRTGTSNSNELAASAQPLGKPNWRSPMMLR